MYPVDVYTPAQKLSLHLEAKRPRCGLPTGFWISVGFEFDGLVGRERMLRAIKEVQRSSPTYSVLIGIGSTGNPVFYASTSPPPIETVELSDFCGGLDQFARMHETALSSVFESSAHRFRIGYYGDNIRYLHLMLHYLVADRATVTDIFNNLRVICELGGAASAEGAPRPRPDQLTSPPIDEARLDYWRAQLPETALVPKIVQSRSKVCSPKCFELSRELSEQAAGTLRKLILECHATSTAIGIAAWAEYTHLLSGEGDVLIPTLIPDVRTEENGAPRHTLDLIMLRSQRNTNRAFKTAVRNMTNCIVEALDNQVALMTLLENGLLQDPWAENDFIIVLQGGPEPLIAGNNLGSGRIVSLIERMYPDTPSSLSLDALLTFRPVGRTFSCRLEVSPLRVSRRVADAILQGYVDFLEMQLSDVSLT